MPPTVNVSASKSGVVCVHVRCLSDRLGVLNGSRFGAVSFWVCSAGPKSGVGASGSLSLAAGTRKLVLVPGHVRPEHGGSA